MMMKQPINRFLHIAYLLGTLSVLASGCGWVEVPIKGGSGPQLANVPSSSRKSLDPTQSLADGMIVVQKGDSLWLIAQRYNLPMRALIDQNKLTPPYNIYAGQRLELPKARFHVVVKGDTLYGISRLYNADIYSLAQLNNLASPYMLTPGQKLQLPDPTYEKQEKLAALKTEPLAAPEPEPAETKPSPPSYKPSATKSEPQIAKVQVPEPPKRAGGRFNWPVKGKVVSTYGVQKDGLRNDGINIAAKRGEPIKAAEHGVVAYSGNELRGFGNMLLIKHSDGWISAYAHADKLLVKRGDKITKGQVIAHAGSTGSVSEPQVHFELRKGMRTVDPTQYLGG